MSNGRLHTRGKEGAYIAKSVARLAAVGPAMTASLFGSPASATEGYFQQGYSAIQQSLGGADVANPEDPLAIAVNPAALTSVGTQLEIGASLFSPHRQYSVSPGSGFVAPGTVDSNWNYFGIPYLGYSGAIGANSAWGVALYGNGGMNTSYPAVFNPACGPGDGVFCGGKAGVNLEQLFISPAYAYRLGNVSIGLAPIFAVQTFNAKGLAAFSPISQSPGDLTNRGTDTSWGGGLRVGGLWSVLPNVRLALAGATPIWMTDFGKYSGLFAGQGSFDIPASVTAGGAWDVVPNVTRCSTTSTSSIRASRRSVTRRPSWAFRSVRPTARASAGTMSTPWPLPPSGDSTHNGRCGLATNTTVIRSSRRT